MKSLLIVVCLLISTTASAGIKIYKLYPVAYFIPNIKCDIYREIIIESAFYARSPIALLTGATVRVTLENKLAATSTCLAKVDPNVKNYMLGFKTITNYGAVAYQGLGVSFIDSSVLAGRENKSHAPAISFLEGEQAFHSTETVN